MYWALRQWLLTEGTRGRGSRSRSSTPTTRRPCAPRCGPARRSSSGSRTPANPLWGLTDIEAAAGIAHAAGAKLAVDLHLRLALPHPPPDSRRRRGDARGDEDPQRPFGRGRRRAGGARDRRLLAAAGDDPQGRRRDPGAVRGLSADPRHAHIPPARGGDGRLRHGAGGALPGASARRVRALSRPAGSSPATTSPRRQMENGFGYMLSIRVAGGEAAAIATAARVGLWTRATSLGGVESLIRAPRLDRGAGQRPARRTSCGSRWAARILRTSMRIWMRR